jgi:tetrahydromethanopterin S-methyltransferase subunit G
MEGFIVTEDRKLNGWSEWAHRVLGDIERLDEKEDKMQTQLNQLAIEIAILKTKAAMIGGLWGAIFGIIVSVVTAIILHRIGAQ